MSLGIKKKEGRCREGLGRKGRFAKRALSRAAIVDYLKSSPARPMMQHFPAEADITASGFPAGVRKYINTSTNIYIYLGTYHTLHQHSSSPRLRRLSHAQSLARVIQMLLHIPAIGYYQMLYQHLLLLLSTACDTKRLLNTVLSASKCSQKGAANQVTLHYLFES